MLGEILNEWLLSLIVLPHTYSCTCFIHQNKMETNKDSTGFEHRGVYTLFNEKKQEVFEAPNFIFIFLYFFIFFFILFFISFFFPFLNSYLFSSKLGLTPSWNKETPLDGQNLQRDAQRFPPHLDFCVKVKCAIGSPFECVPTPKSIKVFSWCSSHILGHRMSHVLLNRHLKWLGPRIPEGAYYP